MQHEVVIDPDINGSITHFPYFKLQTTATVVISSTTLKYLKIIDAYKSWHDFLLYFI